MLKMKLPEIFFLLTLGTSMSLLASAVETVPNVDLNLYLGKWYEVASIPQSFQKKCVANTTADYSLAESGMIRVLNSCDQKDGSRDEAEGRARVEASGTNSKLKVTFVKIINWIFLLGGNYWIIDLAPDYSYAVVGDPSRKYAWILSRTAAIDIVLLTGIEKRLTNQGYDTSKILTSVQDGGFKTRIPLKVAVGG